MKVSESDSQLDVQSAQSILLEIFPPWVKQLNLSVFQLNKKSIDICMEGTKDIYRPGDIICGQSLLALADTSMVMCLIANFGELRPTATVDLSCSFMKPLVGEKLFARAKIVRVGKTMAFTSVTIDNGQQDNPGFSATATYILPPAK